MEVKLKSTWNRHLEELLHEQNHHFNRSEPAVTPQRDALQYYWPACRSVEVVTCQSEFSGYVQFPFQATSWRNLHVIDYVNILGVWSSHGIRRYSYDSFLVGKTIQKICGPLRDQPAFLGGTIDRHQPPRVAVSAMKDNGDSSSSVHWELLQISQPALAGCPPKRLTTYDLEKEKAWKI